MSSASAPPYETILRLCQQAGREPWYPNEFAKTLGADPRKLEAPIDDLLYAGLIEQAQGQSGRGQGYRLTRAGLAAVESPREMARLRAGQLPHQHHDSGPEPEAESQSTTPDRRAAVLACLRGGTRPWATYMLFAANVGIFIWGLNIACGGNWGGGNLRGFLLGGDAAVRHRTGAVAAADLVNGQWWRLLTSPFVHHDIFHLLINMSTFMAFGRRAEKQFGCLRYLLIYLMAGFGSVAVALWNDPSISPIGASGAVCGILLAIAVWYVLNAAYMPKEVYREGLRQVGMAFVWWMVWFGLLAFLGNVKFWWVGHIAGAVSGGVAGGLLSTQRFVTNPIRWAFLLLVPLVPAVCVSLLIQAKQSDPAWGEQIKKQRDSNEKELFQKEISPAIRDAGAFLTQHWDDTAKTLELAAKDREAADLKKVRDAASEGREQIDKTLKLIERLRPFKLDRVSEVVEAGEKFLVELRKLIDLTEKCLDVGDKWTDEQAGELKKQTRKTIQAKRRYDNI